MTPMADWGVSCPIVVGDRIYLTTEISDLVCLDKKTGKVLWIRSNPEFEGLSDEELKEEPALANLKPLAVELAKANAELVNLLNTGIATAPKAATQNIAGVTAKKKAIEKKINEGQLAVNKKQFDRYWGQAVFGFSGPTPTSDGKHVCAFFTTGVSACYDLDGKRKWITRGKGGGSEHGNFASPVLVDGKLAVWANEMRGYDVETGKLAWSHPAKASNTYGSLFRLKSGKDDVAAFQSAATSSGSATAEDDLGQRSLFGDAVSTPVVEGDTICTYLGRLSKEINDAIFKEFRPAGTDKIFLDIKIPDSTEGTKLKPYRGLKIEVGQGRMSADRQEEGTVQPRLRRLTPSTSTRLVYQMTQGCGLVVNDAATGEVVYRKVLPMKPRTEYWNWAGASTSPTLAGKYIYLMDNQGGTVIIEPGRTYKEVARNVLEEVSATAKEQGADSVDAGVRGGAHVLPDAGLPLLHRGEVTGRRG